MKNSLKIIGGKILSILFAIFLTACGSGGGGGDGDAGSTPVPEQIQLSANTVIIDDQNTLDSLNQSSVGTQTLTFSAETEETQDIDIGDILVFGVSSKTPNGLARKVLSVQRNAGATTVVTEQASLDEVIEEGSIKISGFLSPNSPPTTNNPTAVQSAAISGQSAFSNSGFKIINSLPGVSIYTSDEYRKLETESISAASVSSDFNGCVGNYDYVATLAPDTEIATNVLASGCIAFSYSDSVFDVDISLWGGLERIDFSVTPTVTSQLTIDYNSSIGLVQEYNILTIQLPPIPVGPVVITPEVDVVVGVEANAAADVLTGAITDASATIGVEYANNEWIPDFQLNAEFDPLQPTVNTNAEVLVYGGPEIQLLVYDSVGVESNLHGYISLTANNLNDPWWLLYGGLRAGLGVTAELLGKELASWGIPDLISYEIEIARSPAATCDGSHLVLCTNSSACTNAGGYWWSDNTCNSNSESAVGTLLEEDFESYALNTWPSSWVPDANAHDSVNNRIIQDPQDTSNQVLKTYGIVGGCWGALTYYPIPYPDDFYVELRVYNGSEPLSGCHPARGGFSMKQGTSWTNPGFSFILFQDTTVGHGWDDVLLNTQTNRWYDVKIHYVRSGDQVTLTYWIDGVNLGQTTESVDLNNHLSLDHFELVVQEGSAYFDDIKIYTK